MQELIGHSASLGWVAIKAALLFLTAVFAFRIAERRTLAEMGAFDFVAAVAVGAIVGRVPNSTTTSFAQGGVTLLTILLVHAFLTRLRYWHGVSRAIDHVPRILVRDGRLDERQMRRSGLTHSDLFALLRTEGVRELKEVRYVIFEQRGSMTVVREENGLPDGELVQAVLSRAG